MSRRGPAGAAAVEDTFRTIAGASIGVLMIYWLFVVILRSEFGVHLPDPVDALPAGWRSALPADF
jgi:hypothetical protein